jgi:hypothetical protein
LLMILFLRMLNHKPQNRKILREKNPYLLKKIKIVMEVILIALKMNQLIIRLL